MKEQQCEIIIEPGHRLLRAMQGDNLYTLLLVSGTIDAEDPLADRLRLEKGSVSPAANPEAESAAFTPAELTEGWLLASERRVLGDAVFMLHTAGAETEAEAGGRPLAGGYGMAFDVGSGTLAAGLVDLDTTRIPLLAALRNSQIDLAAEPDERRAFCRRHADGSERMNALLREDLAWLTEKLLDKAGIKGTAVHAVTMAGNELMLRLLRQLPPEEKLPVGQAVTCPAASLHLAHFAPETPIYLLPMAGPEIGADSVASCLAAGLMQKKESAKITLLVDIGMRGEIIAAGRGRLLAASVSSTPFEGVGISCGMQSVTGAITHVLIEDDTVTLRTVRDGRPRGLCGAGLVSAAHVLLELGVLDSEGHLLPPDDVPEPIAARFRGTAAGREFLLSKGDRAFPHDICVNQADILQLQMAKGAIYAACHALLSALGATAADIGEILLAEAYRANLSPTSVQALGMLPKARNGQVLSIGNASWQGAYLALSNRRYLKETEQIAAAIKRLDLTADLVYAEQFIIGMNFPQP